MIDVVIEGDGTTQSRWIDVCEPTPEEITMLVEQHQLPAAAVQACLDPLHLPKHERIGDTTFMILRVYDETAAKQAHSFQSITRKLALFLDARGLVTVRRKKSALVDEACERWRAMRARGEPVQMQIVLLDLLLSGVDTFHAPLETAADHIHELESEALADEESSLAWRDIFRTKVRTQTIKRLLWHTQNAVQKFVPQSTSNLPLAHDVRERIASLTFYAESLDDDLDNLLNVQLSLAANRTNEVMRLLTVFSAFFLPLTFVVGVYGMNFDVMPELRVVWGYPAVWVVMIAIVIGIAWWVRRKGWLRGTR